AASAAWRSAWPGCSGSSCGRCGARRRSPTRSRPTPTRPPTGAAGRGAVPPPANASPAAPYTAADCRGWQVADPSAHDCLTAMYALHASHFLKDTLACGLIGLVGLVLYARLRGRWSLPGRIGELFDVELLVGAAAAATVAAIFQQLDV